MAAFKLKDLDNLDGTIQKEHKNWLLNARLKSGLDVLTNDINLARFSLLKFPKLWSGKRVGETSIEIESNAQFDPIDFQKVISRQKQKYRARFLDQEVLRWEKLEEDYKKFLEHLKERFLAQAIKITLESALKAIPDKNQKTKTDLENFYKKAARSPVNWQTQDQCVAEHAKITQAIKKARKSIVPEGVNTLQKLEQLEILSKRRVDMHYENATKKTTADVVTGGISATSSTLGMVTAFAAAALWIGGFFFPPLWVGAAILGAISFVSYVSTAISVGKVVRNGINGRPPSRSEVKDLAIDAALAPLNVFGKIFRGVRHFVKSSRAVESIFKKIKDVGTNLFSNVTDVPYAKGYIEDVQGTYSDARAPSSENDISKTSTAKVLNMLSKKLTFTQAQALVAKLDESLKTESPILVHKQKVYELHLESSLPENLEEFKNSYILDTKNKVLYYIDYNAKHAKINIPNFDQLLNDISEINKENSYTISLTKKKFKDLIKDNEDPTQKKISKLILTTQPSEHAKISDWSFGFRMSIKKELRFIQAALDDYKKLPVNATYDDRTSSLQKIWTQCDEYQDLQNKNSDLTNKINQLKKIVNDELRPLTSWSFGKEMSIYENDLHSIQTALDNYKTLPVDATYEKKVSGLTNIWNECQNYQNTPEKKPVLSKEIQKLMDRVNKELDNLKVMVAHDEDLRTSRPLLVGR